MSRTIADKTKVFNAAESLLKVVHNPRNITNIMVRDKLGGGSFETIGPLLKEWIESKLAIAVAHVGLAGAFEQKLTVSVQNL